MPKFKKSFEKNISEKIKKYLPYFIGYIAIISISLIIVINISVDFDFYVYDYQGNALSGWPKTITRTTTVNHKHSPLIFDVDGDNELEIVHWSADLYAWEVNGSVVSGFPVVTDECTSSAVGDIDNDGKLEIGGTLSEANQLQMYDLDTLYNPNYLVWTQFRFDTNNTGLYQNPISNTPNANFIANETVVLIDQFVDFTFTGSEGDPPASYLWDFGDGSPTSTDQNPIHQYTSAGTYNVSLTVTDDDGDVDIEIKTDYINVELDILPSANFSADKNNIIEGDNIQFTFIGSEGNAPATFLWDFGDSSPTSTEKNPLHQYNTAGIYTVSLTVTDANRDYNTKVKANFINVEEIPTVSPPDILGYAFFILFFILFLFYLRV